MSLHSGLSQQSNGTENGSQDHIFGTVDDLLDFVTKQWRERWVMTDISNEGILDALLRRPFFILVSVDAPVTLRWRRYSTRYELRLNIFAYDVTCYRCSKLATRPPTLEDFVLRSDEHLYNHSQGLAHILDRAQIRILNSSHSLFDLHDSLKILRLTNEERFRPNWDQYFMQLASLAAQRSNCMKRRVGCVIVRERRVISTGYNGTPRNLRNCNEGGCKFEQSSLAHLAKTCRSTM